MSPWASSSQEDLTARKQPEKEGQGVSIEGGGLGNIVAKESEASLDFIVHAIREICHSM